MTQKMNSFYLFVYIRTNIFGEKCIKPKTWVQFLDAVTKFEKRLFVSVLPSLRMEQLGSHWRDFH
jgi:hypothetical protein